MKFTDGQLRLAATDLSNFLACRHLTRLDTLQSHGLLAAPTQFDLGFQKLIERGELHELRVLEGFQGDGCSVVEIPIDRDTPDAEKAAATSAAMDAGADVVYQGVLLVDHQSGIQLLGRPDFLVRSDRVPGADGSATSSRYEVVDAKLARSAKARAVLQALFYSHLLAEVRGEVPTQVHLALGNREFAPFRVADYAAYERRMRSYLEEFLRDEVGEYSSVEPYPEPVEHCAICRWRTTCTQRRRDDDDLSLIAGMPTTQRVALKAAGVSHRTQFAELGQLPDVDGAGTGALRRSQLQARLQVESERVGRILHELLDPDRDRDGVLVPNRGLLALPEPCEGDLFFDIEGARYYSEDGKEFGLQYLFGIVDMADRDATGVPRYTQIWAFDRIGEKKAFEELVDFITQRRSVNAGLHVYHYNHYEPTSVDHLTELHETREEAVGRLMGRFATHEDEVDDLFRSGVFVDLYRVVRQGLRAGVESYSIKRLEPMIGFERQVGLDEATEHLITFESALEDGEGAADATTLEVVAGYNEDDCRATLALRDWLELRRVDLAQKLGEPPPRPSVEADDEAKVDPEVVRLKGALLEGVPDDPAERSEEDEAKALLADLLEWHRQEAKPAWWRFFRLREMSSAELVDEPDAIGEMVGGDVVGTVSRSIVRRFGFPPQEHGFGPGDKAQDPVSNKVWTVVEVDEERGTIDLKIGKAKIDEEEAPLPEAIVEGGPVGTKNLKARVRDLADRVAGSGFGAADAASALLLRRRPGDGAPEGSPLRHDGERAGDAARRIILGLGGSYLPVQGPPGAGKTFTGADAIVDLVAAGERVGVTAPSHAVIRNLLDAVAERARERRCPVRIGQKADPERRFLHDGAQPLDYGALSHEARGRGARRGGGHGVAVGPRRVRRQRPHAFCRRGRAAVPGQHPGCGGGGGEPGAARRPAATGPAEPGRTSTGSRRLAARPCAGRARHDARRSRASSSTGRIACTRISAGTRPRCSTTTGSAGSRASSTSASAVRRRGCPGPDWSSSRSTTRETPTRPRRRRPRWFDWWGSSSVANGPTTKGLSGRWGPTMCSSSRPSTPRCARSTTLSTVRAWAVCAWGRWTSSRARRHPPSCTPWRPRRPTTPRVEWSSSSTCSG